MNKQTKKNRQQQGFIFLMLGSLVGLMAMAWGCGTEPAPKASVNSAQAFSEAAAIYIPGKTETFRGQNTLISFMPQMYNAEDLQYAGIFPFRLPLVFAQANPSQLLNSTTSPFTTPVDTSMERIRYIIRNALNIHAYFYGTNRSLGSTGWGRLGIDERKKDTVNWRFVFLGQDIMQQANATAPYELVIFGRGGFNAVIEVVEDLTKHKAKVDTVGYIPNRLTARLYWKMQRFFPTGQYDSCMYYMDKLLKFYPLNNGTQYWELVNSGAEVHIVDSDEKVKEYLDKVKEEEGL